jgi:plasmid stabilization system protein ParE
MSKASCSTRANNGGERQVEVYRDKLTGALEALLGNPGSGHTTAELPETHRVYPVASHVIVYRVQNGVIGVLRILHKRMSIPLHV